MKGKGLIGMFIVLMTCLATTLSFAQGPTDQEKEAARNYMDIGDVKMAAGDHEAAYKAYKAADDIMHVPSTGILVAQSLVKLGRLIEAKQKALDIGRIPVKPNEHQVFTDARKEASKMVDQLSVRIPAIEVKIKKLPKDVVPTVKINNITLETEAHGLPFRVNPGQHTVEVSAQGYKTVTRQVGTEEGKTATLEIQLIVDPTAVVPPNKPVPVEPKKPVPTKTVPEATPDSGVSPLVYIGFGVAGAGVIVGAITGGLSLAKKSGLDETYQCQDAQCDVPSSESQQFEDDLDQATLMANISNVSFGVAGAGAILGIVGLFVGNSSPEHTSEQDVRLTLGLGQLGIAGRF